MHIIDCFFIFRMTVFMLQEQHVIFYSLHWHPLSLMMLNMIFWMVPWIWKMCLHEFQLKESQTLCGNKWKEPQVFVSQIPRKAWKIYGIMGKNFKMSTLQVDYSENWEKFEHYCVNSFWGKKWIRMQPVTTETSFNKHK